MQTIKWGVLGTAGIAKGQTIPGMCKAENCELYAIAGRSPEKVQAFQKEFGFLKTYSSYEELLDDPEVQAVYIPLPNHLHYEWAIKAMEAGKHVLCEKPLAPTVDQIREMIACAEKNGVVLMEAFAYLHSPLINAIKAEIDGGAIGELIYADSSFITSDYNMSNIRMQKDTYGGAVYDLGCYNTSQILWLFGEDPEKVMAAADFAENGIDLVTTGILKFSGKKRASFSCGMQLATDEDKRIDRFLIHGSEGFITSDAEFNQCGSLTYTISNRQGVVTKTVAAPHNYQLEVEQLGRCITDGETPLVSHAFTIRNAETLARILDAIQYQR